MDGFEIVVEEIPLRFNENRDAIEGHIARIDHSVVICTGQSGRASISLERVVINVADAKPRTLVALAPWMSSSMV